LATAILAYLQEHLNDILGDVERLVRLESPSGDRERIKRLQDANQESFEPLGEVRRHPHELGDILHVRVPGQGDERIVLLAHMDTVYPVGAWAQPWRIDGDRALGPGAYDMKAGAVQALWAIRAAKALGMMPVSAIDLLLTADEETSSEASRPFIEDLARGAAAVLVLEPPNMDGNLKVARKGVGDYTVVVGGKAAHQGVEPDKGRNAIISAAHFIDEVVKLQDLDKGTTLGPNVIHGGTVSNVVADHARLEVDVRVWDLNEAGRVDAAIRSIQPLEGTSYNIEGGINRPPMEPSDGTMRLLKKAQALAHELGFEVGAARVGGGSDGNFTSRLAPTLDGFGAFGAHAHQKDLEFIHIPSLAPRTALLAGMLTRP
jgi:glutamate carboxypeptidase